LGYILGDVFTSSSGRPAEQQQGRKFFFSKVKEGSRKNGRCRDLTGGREEKQQQQPKEVAPIPRAFLQV
jgi:hypothetical protein